ncbi:F0F1 ATP synthase subunit gamma [Mesoplasma florum]|uniref:ATP synthase F1 subunit gamma n=1 Tax=Mesoplasma florum TaxID=2151 RepID=UPI000D03B684|nr:ATP synthase F1 subunit gamma [Mesoplasma florum]AVN58726.1 F0F1 ATP synthase subunit gamma [Mesoplasma florum]AVN63485.1 F0F1 ATP synthase subunit gamma [Mesoplasma florum]
MANLSNLKTQISNTQDIGKITNAMQLVASAKLRRIGKKVTETQEYVSEVYAIFNEIIKHSSESIYLKNSTNDIKKTLWVVVNSNLGLCGGYNANVNKLVISNFKKEDQIYAIGSKAVSAYNSKKIKIKNECTDVDIDFSPAQAKQIGNELLSYYSSGEFDEIQIVYTKFINNVTFEPTKLRVFPIIKEETQETSSSYYSFEPSAEEVLNNAVTLYLSTIIFGTIVESQVSEQASRRLAMENATNNGKELEYNLSIQYNRERQASITQEISEIVSGANALMG